MPLKPVWFYKGLLQLFTYWSWWQTSTNFDMKHECADAHPKHITICWHIIFPCLCCNDIPTFSELCIMTPSLLLLPAFSSFYSYISLWSLVYFVFFFFFYSSLLFMTCVFSAPSLCHLHRWRSFTLSYFPMPTFLTADLWVCPYHFSFQASISKVLWLSHEIPRAALNTTHALNFTKYQNPEAENIASKSKYNKLRKK